MPEYFSAPFPFHQIIQRSRELPKLSLEESIRMHLRSLILMRVGEFGFDKSLGFEMWDYDKHVFYHERAPYYENKNTEKGLLDQAGAARKHFKENLKTIIEENEIRLKLSSVRFGFEMVEGNLSVYQRKIIIEVQGKIISTGESLSPPFKMSILYTPFQVKSN